MFVRENVSKLFSLLSRVHVKCVDIKCVFFFNGRGQGPTPGCVQRAGQCSQGLDLLFGKVDGAARRLEALINAKQAIARRLDAAQVR